MTNTEESTLLRNTHQCFLQFIVILFSYHALMEFVYLVNSINITVSEVRSCQLRVSVTLLLFLNW